MPKMVIVPAEATEEMREVGEGTLIGCREGASDNPGCRDGSHIYAAMTAASPLSGKVSREVLREAISAARGAGMRMLESRLGEYDASEIADCEADALAAALGLEVAED